MLAQWGLAKQVLSAWCLGRATASVTRLLFLLQQGEPATLDLEKLVSTVSAQKLVLETPAGKVSSLPNHVPSSHITLRSTRRVRLFSGGSCSLGQGLSWHWLGQDQDAGMEQ